MPVAAFSELKFEQQPGPVTGKIGQIERRVYTLLVTGNLRLPSRAHEDFGRDFPIECRSEIHGIASEGIEERTFIMAQIPEVGPDHDIWGDLKGQGRRNSEC